MKLFPGIVRLLISLLFASAAFAHDGTRDRAILAEAVTALANLEAKGTATWTSSMESEFFNLRAEVDEFLRENPEDPLVHAWFEGQLIAADSGAIYGWQTYGSADWSRITGSSQNLAMDRAANFALFAVAPWNLSPFNADTCLAQKALFLQTQSVVSAQDWPLLAAIPAASEAYRLQTWSAATSRAALIRNETVDQPAVDLAALKADIIAVSIRNGGFNPATLQTGMFLDAMTGRAFTDDEIKDAVDNIDERLQASISAAVPFFAHLKTLFDLPPSQVYKRLCE